MLDIKTNNGVVRIALNRPAQRNALSEELIASLRDQISIASRDSVVRAVVLSGNGPSFCGGADAGWLKALQEEDEITWGRATRALIDLLLELARFEKPLIMRLHGYVVGAGAALAACGDHALCSDSTRFLLPELKLGMAPSVVAPFLITKMGAANAKAALMFEADFKAHRARELGLVQTIVPLDELDAAEETVLDAISAIPTGAVAEFKRLFLSLSQPDLDRQAELAWACARRALQERA